MSEWWCQYCNSVVQPVDVTYEETHDPRSGGCGGRVFGGSEKFKQRISADEEIATLQSDLAAAREEIARAKGALIYAWVGLQLQPEGADPVVWAAEHYAREIANAHKGVED